MKPSRVLHVFKHFRPRFAGEGVFVERLAPIFARLRPDVGHEVLVADMPPPAAVIDLPGLDRVHYLAASETGASQSQLIGWLARNAGCYGVVHYHTHVDRTFVGAGLLKARGVRVMLSATLNDSVEGLLATYRPVLRPVVRRLFGLVDDFVAISPRLHEENLRRMPRRRCRLVPMGVPLPYPRPDARRTARARLGLATDAPVLVCVGGLCRRKDQLLLVRELQTLVRRWPDLVLMLVGPGVEADYEAELRRRVIDLGLAAHVRFEGHAAEPWTHYEAADIFVFASRQEGFGTVTIEAMAHGLPVVVRALPGVNDAFIEPGRTGLVFDQDEEFTPLVEGLLGDPARRQALGQAARALVAAEYDIEAVAARYLGLYGYAPSPAARAAPHQRLPFGRDACPLSPKDGPHSVKA